MKINLDSKIRLHPVEIQKEKKFYIVEDQATGEFFEMPEVSVVAIIKISEGLRLEVIELELKSQFPQEEINLLEFVEQLIDLEMVEEIDGKLIKVDQRKSKLGFTWISPSIGRFFFNKSTKIGYTLLFIVNICIFVWNPNLFPHYKDVFIFDVMFQNILAWMILSGILIFTHEMGHILAIRANGFSSKLEVGHRLFFIVLETDLSMSWKLPSRERIYIYLSGLCFDNVLLLIALVTQILFPDGHRIFINILGFIVLDIVLRVIYQCCVFMKTDLYYVLENVTGCHNLMENAKAIILKRNVSLTVFDGERKTIYLYIVFYILGVLLSFVLFVLYYIPLVVYTLLKISPGLRAPLDSVAFYDSIFVMLQFLLIIGLLSYSWRKTYRKSQKQFE